MTLLASIDAYEAILKGFAKGMEIVGDKYKRKEAFIPELLLSASALPTLIYKY